MEKVSFKKNIRAGFLYFAMATALFVIQLMTYMKGSPLAQTLDAGGWLFFITSCISHGAMLAAIPFLLLFMPFCAARRPNTGGVLMTVGVSLLSLLIFIDMQVYDIYRFHINGFVLNMVTSSGASEIFRFDTMLYIKEIVFFVLLVAACAVLWIAALRHRQWCTRRMVLATLGITVGCTFYAHLYYVYAEFMKKQTAINCKKMLPHYYPLKARSLLRNLGFTPPNGYFASEGIGTASGAVFYPLHPIVSEPSSGRPNIVFILIDSWNKRALDAECMPNTYSYASGSLWYDNHISACNRTLGGVFGLFYSVPSYYWDIFEERKVSPVFFDELLRQGYHCQVYPGAEISDFIPFDRTVFRRIPDLNRRTDGNTVYERDCRLTDNFIADMKERANGGQPFFSLLFYDLPHSFELPEDKLAKFQPSWKYMDYSALNNDIDPTPVFNLYRNCCYQTDINIGRALQAIEDAGIADNTIVMITGDHGQEFNENRKNYWGHPSNFSKWQIGVPLICHYPGDSTATGRKTYRTTHYDIVPTLMQKVLGVKNPTSDYSMGYILSDSTSSRKWHTMSKYQSIVFIVDNDVILEKTGNDDIEVTDADLNPIDGYKINAVEFDAAIRKLNRFLK